jgi:TP901 family phage tail tape measure protein
MVDFRIRVIVDPKNAEAGSKRVGQSLSGVTKKASALRSSLLGAFAVIGGASVVVGGIRLLADYGQAMSTVKAVAGATEEQFKSLGDTAQQLGISTRFSASQAAEGMVFLARSGLQVDEVMKTIKSTLNLAQAGSLDLGSASKITAETMRAFRLEAEDATRIVDVFAKTANSANTDVAQLGQGMKFVGAVATGLGVSLETTTAAMAALSDAGLQATMAGTGLRKVLAELESPSKKSEKLLSELGLSADDYRVSTVGAVEALTALRDAGVDTGLALEIFGQRGGPAFEILSNSIPKIERMNYALNNAGGTSDKVSKIMDKNLKGALLSLRSAWEGLILKMGGAGEETSALTGIVRNFTVALRALADNVQLISSLMSGLFTIAIGGALAFLLKKFILFGTVTKTVMITTLAGVKSLSKEVQVFSGRAALAKVGKFLTNPFVALTAAATGAYLALQKFNAVLEETNEANKVVMEGVLTEYGALGQRIFNVQKRIKSLQKDLEKKPDSPVSLKALEQAQKQLAELTDETKKYREQAQEEEIQKQRSSQAYQKVNKQLAQEVILLGMSNRERRIQKELYGIIGQLEEEGFSFSGDEELKDLEARIKQNQLLRDQAEILDRLRGPQDDYQRGARALQQLFADGKITLEEYRMELQKLSDELSKPVQSPYEALTEDLEKQIEVLRVLTTEGEAASRAKEAEQQLTETGTGLNDVQREKLKLLYETIGALEAEANKIDDVTKKNKELTDQENAVLREKKALLEEMRGPLDDFFIKQQALLQLVSEGVITWNDYIMKLEELQNKSAQAANTIEGGFLSAMQKIEDEIMDVSGHVQDFFVGSFNAAQDALTDFVKTGEMDMDKLRTAIADLIAELLVKMMTLYAFSLITGIPIGSLMGGNSFLGGGGRAAGGGVMAGKSYIVGENGPERFVPPTTGTIVPAGETAAMQNQGGGGTTVVETSPPNVNVQVVNVDDPSAVPQGMDSPAGDKVIMNALQRNKNAAKGILG